MRDNFSEALFSLFTSPDHAAAIAGDLAEERKTHGSAWFWVHVVRITLALWRCAAADTPLRVLALTIAPIAAGTAAVGLFPQLFDLPAHRITVSLLWCGMVLFSGALLSVIARRAGRMATVTL